MTLTEEKVHGYEAFKKRVEELKGSQSKLAVLFTGSKSNGRLSWCPDCNDCMSLIMSLYTKICN